MIGLHADQREIGGGRCARGAMRMHLRNMDVADQRRSNPQAVAAVFEKTREFGLLIGKGGLWGHVIRLGPALTCSKNDVDEAVKALDRAFAALPQQ